MCIVQTGMTCTKNIRKQSLAKFQLYTPSSTADRYVTIYGGIVGLMIEAWNFWNTSDTGPSLG